MTEPPIVLLEWEDAKTIDSGLWSEESKEHVYKPHVWRQVGYLLSNTEEGVIVTQAWHPESCAARDQIPRAMIRSMTVLVPQPTRKRK